MLFPRPDPNEQFRAQRAWARRARRLRRSLLLGGVLVAVLAVALGMTVARPSPPLPPAPVQATVTVASAAAPVAAGPRALPTEIRGVHVTGALASLDGKLEEYIDLVRYGLNTIELDVKDESGFVAFKPAGVPLAERIGATRSFYRPAEVARLAHANGVYLIGRIVVFQDPILARARPDLAVQRPDGSGWATSGGHGWVNPYERRVWDYTLGIAAAAAKAGFDEIMLDYVRFPSDGDVASARYPGRTSLRRGEVIADFVAYAEHKLRPLGVRVSVALFGLAATRDLRIGQVPAWIGQHVDHVYPMAYPALYGSGELGLADPSAAPGETVYRTLAAFRNDLRSTQAELIPWIQDWGYRPEDVRRQVEASRLQGARGFLLWNAEGIYTTSVLAPQPG